MQGIGEGVSSTEDVIEEIDTLVKESVKSKELRHKTSRKSGKL